MDPYSFLRSLDSRSPFFDELDGLNPLSTLSGLSLQLPLPSDVRVKGRAACEEAALEAKIVEKIYSGDWESLKPNSGTTISLGEHQICVAFHDDSDSGYRIWEWHGHLLIFNDEDGYSPEYIYGTHFQSLDKKLQDDDDDEVDVPFDKDDFVDQHALCDGIAALGLSSVIPLHEKQQQQQLLLKHAKVVHRMGNTKASTRT